LRLRSLVGRYLSRRHRDAPGMGCLLPAVSAEIGRAPVAVRETYDALLKETVASIEEALGDDGSKEEAHARAVGALALCVGGLLLARASEDTEFSDDVLRCCLRFAAAKEEGEDV
jgi:TetR/AcrR family transcriptional repressor of nem operon